MEDPEVTARRIAKAQAGLAGFKPTGVDAKGHTQESTYVVRDGVCPKCGGNQFKARRTGKARFGVFATGLIGWAATKQRKVECVTCGTVFDRD